MTAFVCESTAWALWHCVQQNSETGKMSVKLLKVNDLVTQSTFFRFCPPCEDVAGCNEIVREAASSSRAVFCPCVIYSMVLIHWQNNTVGAHIATELGESVHLSTMNIKWPMCQPAGSPNSSNLMKNTFGTTWFGSQKKLKNDKVRSWHHEVDPGRFLQQFLNQGWDSDPPLQTRVESTVTPRISHSQEKQHQWGLQVRRWPVFWRCKGILTAGALPWKGSY